MSDKHQGFRKMNRRSVLASLGALGAAGTIGAGTAVAQSSDGPSQEAVEAAVNVPCVDHFTTVDAGDLCYVAAGLCLLIPTPAGAIAAKGCAVSGATCFALETIERLGCGDGKIHIYEITCPVPGTYKYVAVPDCFGDIAGVLYDVIAEYVPGVSAQSSDAKDVSDTEFVEVESEGEWAVSEQFLEEYDAEGEIETADTA